jgi:hypothetical protein
VTADAVTARRRAGELVADLRQASAGATRFEGVDLAGAIEQQLFFAIREGRPADPNGVRRLTSSATATLRPAAAFGVGLMAWRLPKPGRAPLVVLVREPTHYPVLAQIEAELQASAGEPLALVRVGRAAGVAPAHAVAPRLVELMDPPLAFRVSAYRRRVEAGLRAAAGAWALRVGEGRAAELRRLAGDEAGRIALGAAALLSVARRWRPRLLAAFDEIGTWARLLPEVARQDGIPSLDLPHAEAADPIAIRGAAYDCMATYGPRATAVLGEAGVTGERIVEIGAPRFDPLVRLMADAAGRPADRRVVFAAQYVTDRMTPEVHEACFRAALAAAAAFTASELAVVPHPAEPRGTAAGLVEGAREPPVPVRLAADSGLHAEVAGAGLLITGWSNSVFEAAVAGIPAITVNPGGVAPVDFAADGLATGASDAASAARVAADLVDESTRDRAVARARQVAIQRLGPLDGRASERAARLMLALARGEPWRSAA